MSLDTSAHCLVRTISVVCVIDAVNRGAHLVAGSHRLPRSGVDVFAGAKGRPQRRGVRLRDEDVNGVMHTRRVPSLKLRVALRKTKQAQGALDVAVRGTPPSCPKGGKGSIQGS